MAGFGWIHTRFRSFDLELWHRFQQRNLTSTKTEKQKNNTIKTHHITKKHSTWRFTRKKHKKGKINQSKPGVCAVLFILWFVFGVLVLFLVFLFVFWVSSFLFFCVQCFCIFLDLTIFQKCCVFQTIFHYKEHQNKFLVVYNLGIERKTDPKCMKGRGDSLTPPWNTCLGLICLDFRHAWK